MFRGLDRGVAALLAILLGLGAAHANGYDWAQADTASGTLCLRGGPEVDFRAGAMMLGEHKEIAVELTWETAGDSVRTQQIVREMADSAPRVTTQDGRIVVTWSVWPWRAEKAIEVARCWKLSESEGAFTQVPCPDTGHGRISDTSGNRSCGSGDHAPTSPPHLCRHRSRSAAPKFLPKREALHSGAAAMRARSPDRSRASASRSPAARTASAT